jgi:hypothetical protein
MSIAKKRVGVPAREGIGVDSAWNPTVDPSENVKALSEAANTRQDDLRNASERYCTLEVMHVKELAEQHAMHDRELHATEERYTQQLREAEAKRIDAIRAVDVNAVSVAAERSADQASVLAAQVTQSADALRTLVATTAAAQAQAQQQTDAAMSERITKLEQAQYTGAGRASFADPQMEALITQMKALTASNAVSAGKGQGIGLSWGVIIGIGTLILALSSLPSILTAVRGPVTAAAPAPQMQIPSGYVLVPAPK